MYLRSVATLIMFEYCLLSGSGWLTVRVVAVYLGDDISKVCGSKLVRSSKAGKRCNPYVKFIVDYPSGRKNYTVKVDVRYIGWVIVDKKIRFDEAPEDTKIQIQMWNHKEGKRKDEQLFQQDTNFGYLAYKVMLDRSKKIISNYKLFFMSIWRDRFSYENTSFAVDKYGDQ